MRPLLLWLWVMLLLLSLLWPPDLQLWKGDSIEIFSLELWLQQSVNLELKFQYTKEQFQKKLDV